MWAKKILGAVCVLAGVIFLFMNASQFDQLSYVVVGFPVFLIALGVYLYRKSS
jgi:uncharacterized membrane protein